MISVANEINEAWLNPSRQLAIKIVMNGEVYTNEDVTSFSFDSGSISGESFQIGSAYMNQIQFSLVGIVESVATDQELTAEVGILVGETYHYTKLGKFIVSDFDRNRNDKKTDITAVDQMILLEGAYESALTYPAQIRNVALEIANLAGVEIDQTSFSTLPTTTINKPEGYTYRQAIGLIAQFDGGFANFNREGKLQVRGLAPTTFTITADNYMLKGFTKNETAYRPNGIAVRTGDEETDSLSVGSSSGNIIELENKVMTQTSLNAIWAKVKDINYFPFEVKWQGNPNLEAGDWFYIKDRDGTRYSVPNLSYSFTYNGGMSAESKATTSSNSEVAYQYRGTLKQQIEKIQGVLQGANGWNSNYYDATTPPNPKVGDTWFKPNGKDTEIWVYENVDDVEKWVFKISSASDPELLDAIEETKQAAQQAELAGQQATQASVEATQKADEARIAGETAVQLATTANQDAQTALSNANSAVSLANQAAEDAGFSKTTADEAKSLAVTANSNASTALSNAQTAINTANSAKTDVTTLTGTVNNLTGEVALKATKQSVDMLTGRVSTAEGSISANTQQIALRATKTEVNTLSGTVSSLDSKLTTEAGKITALNTLTSGHTTQIGSLQSSYSGLQSTVASVRTDLDGLEVGGRNYILKSPLYNSNDSTKYTLSRGVDSIGSWVSGYRLDTDKFYINAYPQFNFTNGFNEGYYSEDWTDLKGYRSYSMEIMCPYELKSVGINQTDITDRYTLPANTWVKFSFSTNTKSTRPLMFLYATGNNDSVPKGTKVYYRKCKMEKGNKATDWSPAPEDYTTVTAFSDFQQNVNGFQTTTNNAISGLQSQQTITASSLTSLIEKTDWKTIATVVNLNDFKTTGKFFLTNTTGSTNLPAPAWGYLTVDAKVPGSERVIQSYQRDNDNRKTYQRIFNGTTWSDWKTIADNIDISNANSRIDQTVSDINLRVTKAQLIGEINTQAGKVLIRANDNVLMVTPTTTYIQDATIKTAHIADLAVNDAKIANGAVTTLKVGDLAVTEGKIANLAVSTGKIADLAVSTAKIDNSAITSAKIGDAQILTAHIKDAQISSAKIISLDASKISANKLSAITANLGDITAGTITGVNTDINLNTGLNRFYLNKTKFPEAFVEINNVGLNIQNASKNRVTFNAGTIAFYSSNFNSGNSASSVINAVNQYASPNGGNFNITAAARPGNTNHNIIGLGPNSNGITITTNDRITLGYQNTNNNTNEHMVFDSYGIRAPGIYRNTDSRAANVYIAAKGYLYRSVSARKYKEDIKVASSIVNNAKKILEISPSAWRDKKRLKEEGQCEEIFGFIADEFHELGLTEVVEYGEDGQVESLAYDRIPMYHNVILRDHDQAISQLNANYCSADFRIRVLEEKVNKLEEALRVA